MEANNDASEDNRLTTGGQDMTSAQDSTANRVLLNVNSDNVSKGGVPNIYAQDVVRSSKTNMIGIVTEVAGDLDSDSGITDDDSDDDDDGDEDCDESNDSNEDEGEGEAGENDDEDGDGEDDENKEEKDYPLESSNENHEGSGTEIKNGPLSSEELRVLWLNGTESTENINDVSAIDRGFLHGDYVASSSDPTGQLGVVVDVDIYVDLLSHDGTVVENVSARDLRRVKDFAVGDYVVLGPWLGRVDDVLDNVTVQVDDGSICKVTKAEPMRLKPMTKNLLEDGNFPYYPGQRVKASSSSVFKSSRWKSSKSEGTVTRVTVGSVFVYWIASAGYGPNSATPPAEEQSPKNLKLLSCFTYANWQLGDWCLLSSAKESSSITLEKDMSNLEVDDSEEAGPEESNENEDIDVTRRVNKESWPVFRKRVRKVVVKRDKKSRKKEENFERALQIVNIRTTVNVLWQDGVIESRVVSTELIPIETPGDHDFVAEQYVVEKAADDEDYAGEPRRVGVVKSVNAKERTARVNWLKLVSRAEDPRQFDKEEIVSVYELEGHPDYDYCYGDVVVRLSPVSTVQIAAMDSMEEKDNNVDTEKSSSSNKEDMSCDEGHANFSDLSWVGNITGLRNGDIEVTWADEMVSSVGPQAIYVVGREDDDSLGDGSAISEAASWETVEDDETDVREDEHEEHGMQSADRNSSVESVDENAGRNSALSLPFAALEFVSRIASGIFSRGRRNTELMGVDHEEETEMHSESMMKQSEGSSASVEESNSEKAKVLDIMDEEVGDERVSSDASNSLDAVETVKDLRSQEPHSPTSNVDDTSTYKHFDIVNDPIDHYFLGTNTQSHNARKWLKKVHQDWDILQNNLPDEVYVRVYEDRMDLLRAAIVGAYGTPYQDGLFFFDFHLPPEYPDVPPVAYYHSGGWRINPNLYEEGKVCLSLLNTWTGRGNEVWDSSSSSILQVLVSLQGLVLNAKPYFNEAGYDKQVGTAEGEKNSLSYNENTFLLNCKTMMNLMRRPPKDFDELVKEHFRKRGYYILKACDAYMKGYLIGSLAKDASIINEGDANSTSVGFKLMLAKIVPKLLLSLEEVGVDCNEFDHLRQS